MAPRELACAALLLRPGPGKQMRCNYWFVPVFP